MCTTQWNNSLLPSKQNYKLGYFFLLALIWKQFQRVIFYAYFKRMDLSFPSSIFQVSDSKNLLRFDKSCRQNLKVKEKITPGKPLPLNKSQKNRWILKDEIQKFYQQLLMKDSWLRWTQWIEMRGHEHMFWKMLISVFSYFFNIYLSLFLRNRYQKIGYVHNIVQYCNGQEDRGVIIL